MSDSEDIDLFFKLWTSPVKSRRKKGSKKDKKGPKHKNKDPKEGNMRKKKKKNSKFKGVMEGKKEKKKKKTSKALEVNDNPDQPIPDSTGKAKRKKKVAFDLSSSYICVKRPKYASSSPKLSETVGDEERCSQLHDNDSQGDDMNSQDLFITQKTFRVSLSQPSSGETSDKPITATPPTVEETQEFEQPPKPQQKNRKAYEYIGETKSGGQAGEDVKLCEVKRTKVSGLKVNHPKERQEPSPASVTPHLRNLYLNEPIIVDSSPDAVKTNSGSSQRLSSSVPHVEEALSRRSTSTQTENFFTTELSYYFSFCHRATAICAEDLKPLDLSLPRKARKDLCSGNTSALEFEDVQEPASLPVGLGGSQKEMRKRKKRNSGPVEKTPSPQSESEAKSGDTMTSSEDSESHSRLVKVDLNQMRAIQTRLNESFFFKTKGEAQSPRPESPLMKLAQGREVKGSKKH